MENEQKDRKDLQILFKTSQMKATAPLPGILQVQATDYVTVSYDAQYNMVEILEQGRVIRSEIAPKGYTAAAFVTTLQRVRQYYAKN